MSLRTRIRQLLVQAQTTLGFSGRELRVHSEFLEEVGETDLPFLAYYLSELGQKASTGEHPELARDLQNAALEAGMDTPELHYNLGNACLNLGEEEDAIRHYDRAIELDPKAPLPYCNRGIAHRRLGNVAEGSEDLLQAARLGCEFEPMYLSLCDGLIEQEGFEAVYRRLHSEHLPERGCERILARLEERLGVLYQLSPVPGVTRLSIDPRLQLRCRLADAFLSVAGEEIDVIQALALLSSVLTDSVQVGDPWAERCAHYLLGLLFYSPTALSGFPPGLPLDVPEILQLMSWSGDTARRSLEAYAEREAPALRSVPTERKLAEFARMCFERACRDSPPTPFEESRFGVSAEGVETLWMQREDMFREWARSCVFLRDPEQFFSCVEAARYGFATLRAGMLSEPRRADSLRRQLDRHYRPARLESTLEAIGSEGLLLQYFLCEIVEDRLLRLTASVDDAVLSEAAVPVLSRGTRSLLDLLLEANVYWMPRELRIRRLEDAKTAFRRDPELKEGLLGAILSTAHGETPQEFLPEVDELLLGDAGQRLAGCRRLVVMPYNYLHNFPFHALTSVSSAAETGHLEEIAYLPSARLALSAHTKAGKGRLARGSRSLLFVGYAPDGDIPLDRELEIVSGHFAHVRTLVGDEATREGVLREMARADAVHFCCHGRYGTERKALALELADGHLLPWDILEGPGPAPGFVFTNACISGVVPRSSRNGDQTLGLHSAFLLKGARQVIGTLWPVRNDIACELAEGFYESWVGEPELSTAKSLLRCQLRLKQEHGNIALWAPHALFGHWE